MEFAGVAKAARSKTGVWKIHEWTIQHRVAEMDFAGVQWTMWHHVAGVDNAGVQFSN